MEAATTGKHLMSIALLRVERLTELVELAEQQRSILIEGRHAELAENVKAQDLILAELDHLQKREDSLFQTVSSRPALGLSEEYESAGAKASRTAQRLKSVTRGNRDLLDSTMQYVAFSMSILSGLAADQQISYDPKSEAGPNTLAMMLDRKV
jgi:hypothetical protein